VHTKSEERPPVRIQEGAVVKDSMITDGCVIAAGARVEKSVLSPGATVGPGAVIRYSVILTDTSIEAGARNERPRIHQSVHAGRTSGVLVQRKARRRGQHGKAGPTTKKGEPSRRGRRHHDRRKEREHPGRDPDPARLGRRRRRDAGILPQGRSASPGSRPEVIPAFLLAVAALAGGVVPASREVAVTFDDLPGISVPGGGIAEQRAMTEKLVSAFTKAKAPVTAFVNEGKLGPPGAPDPERVALLERCPSAGIELGHHTRSHPDLHPISL